MVMILVIIFVTCGVGSLFICGYMRHHRIRFSSIYKQDVFVSSLALNDNSALGNNAGSYMNFSRSNQYVLSDDVPYKAEIDSKKAIGLDDFVVADIVTKPVMERILSGENLARVAISAPISDSKEPVESVLDNETSFPGPNGVVSLLSLPSSRAIDPTFDEDLSKLYPNLARKLSSVTEREDLYPNIVATLGKSGSRHPSSLDIMHENIFETDLLSPKGISGPPLAAVILSPLKAEAVAARKTKRSELRERLKTSSSQLTKSPSIELAEGSNEQQKVIPLIVGADIFDEFGDEAGGVGDIDGATMHPLSAGPTINSLRKSTKERKRSSKRADLRERLIQSTKALAESGVNLNEEHSIEAVGNSSLFVI